MLLDLRMASPILLDRPLLPRGGSFSLPIQGPTTHAHRESAIASRTSCGSLATPMIWIDASAEALDNGSFSLAAAVRSHEIGRMHWT